MQSAASRAVMLIEDDGDFRQALVERMTLEGYEVRAFAAAEPALKAVAADFDGAVVTDLRMPGLDGRQLLARIQALDPALPVIMITGHSTMRRVAEARDAGVNEFLAKPLTARGVLERLNRIVEHPRPYIRTQDYCGPGRRRRADPGFNGPWRRQGDAAVSLSHQLD